MNAGRIARGVLWAAYGVLWVGGAGGHLLFGGTPADMGWTAPVFLLLAGLLAIVSAPEEWRALAFSFAAGFAAEAIGVATGYPFGGYVYSSALAPSLLGVPLVVAGAWMVLIAWVRQLWLPVWAGAIAMALFDLVIDPLAANTLGYWRWRHAGPYYGVPLLNFVGWFAVSFLILAALRAKPARNAGVVALGCSILIFFAFVALAHGFVAPTAAGFFLCGLGYWKWRSSSVSASSE